MGSVCWGGGECCDGLRWVDLGMYMGFVGDFVEYSCIAMVAFG